MNLIIKKIHFLGLLLLLYSSHTYNSEQGFKINSTENNTYSPNPTSSEFTKDVFFQLNQSSENKNFFNKKGKFKSNGSSDDQEQINQPWQFPTPYNVSFQNPELNNVLTNIHNLNLFIKQLDEKVTQTFQRINKRLDKLEKKNSVESTTTGNIMPDEVSLLGTNPRINGCDYFVNYDSNNQTVQLMYINKQNFPGVYPTKKKITIASLSDDSGKNIIKHTQNQAKTQKLNNSQQFYTTAAKLCNLLIGGAAILTAGAIGTTATYIKNTNIQNIQTEFKDHKQPLMLIGGFVGVGILSWIGSGYYSTKVKNTKKHITKLFNKDKKLFKKIQPALLNDKLDDSNLFNLSTEKNIDLTKDE